MHPAATFQFRRPGASRYLLDIANDDRFPFVEFAGPKVERQLVGVKTDRGRPTPLARDRGVRPRRDKDSQPQIFARAQQRKITADDFFRQPSEIAQGNPRVELDNFQGTEQPLQVFFEAVEFAGECAKLLGNGGAEHEADIVERNGEFALRKPTPVEKSLHGVHAHRLCRNSRCDGRGVATSPRGGDSAKSTFSIQPFH